MISSSFALLVFNDDVDDDHKNDVDHEEEKPNVRQFQVWRLWQSADDGGEKRGEHQKACDCSHESVVKIFNINEECQVD